MERNYIDELRYILQSEIPDEEKKNKILQYHESDIADLLDELTPLERGELYEILGDEDYAEVLLYAEDIGKIVDEMNPEDAADVIETLDADDAIDVLDELDEDQRNEIVALLDEEAREDINQISSYDEDQIGSLMTNNYITIGIWEIGRAHV